MVQCSGIIWCSVMVLYAAVWWYYMVQRGGIICGSVVVLYGAV